MPSPGIDFIVQRPPAAVSATRADVAVFAGLIARAPGVLPVGLRADLAAAGWSAAGSFAVSEVRLQALLGVPVAVGGWAEFDALFDWRARESVPGAADRLPCALGLAVRQFFLQGGARAWVIRCGDPLPLTDPALDATSFGARQLTALAGPIAPGRDAQAILPGFQARTTAADPLDPATWTGAAAIFAIDDAAMLLLPDLPELAAGPAEIAPPLPDGSGAPEIFIPCAPAVADDTPPLRDARPRFLAPRLGQAGYRLWSAALAHTLALLGTPRGPAHRRDVMLVGALPIPGADMPHGAEQAPLLVLAATGNAGTDAAPLAPFDAAAIGSARLQLAYPWLATSDSQACAEGLQSPEGALAGLIARSTLAAGGFRSAAGQRLRTPVRLYPELAESDIARGSPGSADWLGDRLCLLAPRRGAIALISDATAALDRAWRKGGTSRLIGILLRAARQLGEELMFEPAGPALWSRLTGQVTGILEALRALGAFAGATPDECYQVVCDARSMTAADIDAGRIRCDVVVNAASPIERISVTLALVEPLPAIAFRPQQAAA